VLEPGTRSLGLAQMLDGLGARLVAAGVPVRRMRTSVTTKHPELFVRAVMWHAERGTDVRDGKRELLVTATYLGSPVARVRAGESRIRCRLTGPDADLSFAICGELAAEGLTDYAVYPLMFGTGERTYFSFATDAADGFSAADLALLEALLPVLGVRVELESAHYALSSLLDVYLGHNAASRVLAGSFLRGTGQPIHAAIWFCDMRASPRWPIACRRPRSCKPSTASSRASPGRSGRTAVRC
jgi:adenylate cyclase